MGLRDGYPTAEAAQMNQSFEDSTTFGERLRMSFGGSLGNAQTQYRNKQAQLQLAQQRKNDQIKDQLFQAITQNFRESPGADIDKEAYSGGVERLYGRDSMQFQTLFNQKGTNLPNQELSALGGGPTQGAGQPFDEFNQSQPFDEPVLNVSPAKGKLINLVNPNNPKDIKTVQEGDRRIGGLLDKGYILRDKPSSRGTYVVPRDAVNSKGETVTVGWDTRKSAAENQRLVQQQLKNMESIVSPKTPSQQGAVSLAKKSGLVLGEERTTAKIDLPKVKSNSLHLKGIVNKILSHPAFQGMVGAPSIDKALQFVSGTQAAGFRALQQQLDGKQFSQAYETLKGGGQITEIEGEKATNALSTMKTSVSEKEFRAAAEVFLTEIDRLQKIAEQRASGKELAEPITGSTTPNSAPDAALEHLRNNNTPEMQQQFEAKYGYLP